LDSSRRSEPRSAALSVVPSPRRVVERYLLEVLSGDGPAGIDDLVANPIFSQQVRALRAAFPDLRVDSRHVLAAGDLVAVHAMGEATHSGPFMGLPSTGRRWRAGLTAVYRVKRGRIIDFWGSWDMLSIMEQLGGIRRIADASA
jgi:predicted ester cyclase